MSALSHQNLLFNLQFWSEFPGVEIWINRNFSKSLSRLLELVFPKLPKNPKQQQKHIIN